ncbi:MAG: RNA polymerase subunit sigma-24 [Acidobacteria bacterium]|jgi:RNA polymerase sigma-70 factor (ECF subfamily)|nr:RNA polymerase subunit sigma-24 [Acidobacteriota bacterium]MDP7338622.1 sigma-70 family RNA polymerase sigma factor [Vicinamibacterales bacterium]MDP7692936.1 sigma-70 family RNA polymerase sigma factor [Vicinamibacterales bacterium]HJN43131.1 sigma-70 family RNA polymerase sigma factor [Vicinamibacterales bacterium]|tara:strand:+ start:1188 stop:1778 length:591 start_codon:yes stop_codon:yes gene_type:complete
MTSDIGALVERCRQGDGLAWERLVRRCQGRVYALAYHYMGGVEEARDLTQEVFVRVYQQLETYHGEGFMAWLLRVTRNLCIDQIRRRKARPPAEDLRADDHEWTMPDTAPDPEQSWLSDARKRLVYDALGKLNGQNREMILLKEIQGLQLKEIAEILGLPVDTVKSRSNRARIELARQVTALDPSYGARVEPRRMT